MLLQQSRTYVRSIVPFPIGRQRISPIPPIQGFQPVLVPVPAVLGLQYRYRYRCSVPAVPVPVIFTNFSPFLTNFPTTVRRISKCSKNEIRYLVKFGSKMAVYSSVQESFVLLPIQRSFITILCTFVMKNHVISLQSPVPVPVPVPRY